MPACAKCNRRRKDLKLLRRGNFAVHSNLCVSQYGTFLVDAAELILRLAPRKAVKVSPRSLDRYFSGSRWEVIERHLRHVDTEKPGIMATLTHEGRKKLFLIEGFHRAENHRRDRTQWAAFVLTPEESYAILEPPGRHWK